MPRTLLALMTPGSYGNKLKRCGSVVCQLCKGQMEVGTKYIRKKSARNSKAKCYHIQCAAKVNLTCA